MPLKSLGIGRYLVGRCLWSEVCALGHSGAALPRFGSGRGSGGALSFVCSWLCWGLRYFRHFNWGDELVCNHSTVGGGTTDYAVDIYKKAIAGENYTCYLKPDSSLPMMHVDDCLRATHEFMKVLLVVN